MNKLILTSSYDFDTPAVQLVDIHSRGVDKSWMQKRAAALTDEISGVQAEPGRSHLHVIAMGSTENYGPNRNADGFRRSELMNKHATFVTNGHVYKHHKNKDPQKASGIVKFSAYNEPMNRVELIIAVDNDKWSKELEKLASGQDLPLSMACKVAHDVCSICNNKAPHRDKYCFVPGTLVTLFDGRTKPIEEVSVGDMVIGTDGYPTKVIKVFSRQIAEKILVIQSTITGRELRVTKNHPIFSSSYEDNICPFRTQLNGTKNPSCFRGIKPECKVCRKSDSKFDYVGAEFIRPGDLLLSPRIHTLVDEDAGSKIDAETAWIYGLFMAEGCYQSLRYIRKDGSAEFYHSGISFCLHEKEQDKISRLQRYFSSRFGKDIKVYKGRSLGVSARVHSRKIADSFNRMLGIYASQKYLKSELLDTLTPDTAEAFLQGMLEGDGHAYKNENRLNSSSSAIIDQLYELSKFLGYVGYVGKPTTTNGGPTNRNKRFSQNYMLTSFMSAEDSRHGVYSRWLGDAGIIGFVRNITKEDYIGPVYNIETEVGSYVANNIAVHNCDHMKKIAGQILNDGRQVYVDNPDPTFFDISGVFRPADRIAYTLQKVASADVVTGADLAEIEGLLDGLHIPVTKQSSMVWRKLAMLKKLSDIEKNIPASAPSESNVKLERAFVNSEKPDDTTMDEISKGSEGRINKVLGALGQAQISLPVKDFIRIVLGNDSHGIEPKEIESHLPGIFTKLLKSGADEVCKDGAYDPMGGMSDLPQGLQSKISSLIPFMSLAEEPVHHRMTIAIIRNSPSPKMLTKDSGIHILKTASVDASSEVLAREYAKYKLAFLTKAAEYNESELLVKLSVLQNYFSL